MGLVAWIATRSVQISFTLHISRTMVTWRQPPNGLAGLDG